jgi:hypothetical protein
MKFTVGRLVPITPRRVEGGQQTRHATKLLHAAQVANGNWMISRIGHAAIMPAQPIGRKRRMVLLN